MATVLLINGPNLNMLGRREPGHYGHASLTGIENTLRQRAEHLSTDMHRKLNREAACLQADDAQSGSGGHRFTLGTYFYHCHEQESDDNDDKTA